MKRASGVFQPSCFTFVSETHQKSCIADCELHTNWMNVEQTIFARTTFSPSTDSLFQALSKWERPKRKENKQLQARTRFSLRSFSLNGSLEQTILLALVATISNDLSPDPSSRAERRSGSIILVGKRFLYGIRPTWCPYWKNGVGKITFPSPPCNNV